MRFLAAACCAVCIFASCASFEAAEDGGSGADAGGDAASSADVAADGASSSPEIVASGQSGVSSIAIDATDIYWTVGGVSGGVATCPKSGCSGPPRIIASKQGNPNHVAVVGDRVAWIADEVVRSAPKSGGPTFDTTTAMSPAGFVVIGEVAYVAEASRVRRCADPWATLCDLSTPSTGVSTEPVAGAVRFGSEVLIWTDSGLIRRVGAATLSAGGFYSEPAGVLSVGVESEIVYLTNDGFLRATATVGGDASAPRQFADGLPTPAVIAVDVANVFVVAEKSGQVIRIPRNGSEPKELRGGLSTPRAIAVDTNEIFVGVAGTGEILRLPK